MCVSLCCVVRDGHNENFREMLCEGEERGEREREREIEFFFFCVCRRRRTVCGERGAREENVFMQTLEGACSLQKKRVFATLRKVLIREEKKRNV
jgi:hypothetical protein